MPATAVEMVPHKTASLIKLASVLEGSRDGTGGV